MRSCSPTGDEELIIVRRVVADHQVAVGIKAGRAAAEGLRAVRIGKDVVAVAVALGDGQRRVERHPENEVRKLAQSPADARNGSAVTQQHTGQIAFLAVGRPMRYQ